MRRWCMQHTVKQRKAFIIKLNLDRRGVGLFDAVVWSEHQGDVDVNPACEKNMSARKYKLGHVIWPAVMGC